MAYVVDYTTRLLWMNLMFLLGIVLLPFSTSFYSEFIYRPYKLPLIIYSINFIYIGLANFALDKYVTNPKRNLTSGLTQEDAALFSFRAILIPIIFALIILVSFFNVWYAVFIPPLIPLIINGLSRVYHAHQKRLSAKRLASK